MSTGFWVSTGDAYTVAGMGPASGLRLQVLKDTLAVPAGRALVRVIQASLRQHMVRVALGGRVLARKLQFARTTSYPPVTAGTQVVRVAGSSEDASLGVSLSSDTIHTLVVLDGARGLRVTSLEDAAGTYRKDRFPTAAVYGPAVGSQLRLITLRRHLRPRAPLLSQQRRRLRRRRRLVMSPPGAYRGEDGGLPGRG